MIYSRPYLRLPFGHAEKYKLGLFPNVGGQDCRTRLGFSADGINWNFYNEGAPVTGRAADFSNQIVTLLLRSRAANTGMRGRGHFPALPRPPAPITAILPFWPLFCAVRIAGAASDPPANNVDFLRIVPDSYPNSSITGSAVPSGVT